MDVEQLLLQAPETLGKLVNERPFAVVVEDNTLAYEAFCWIGDVGRFCSNLHGGRQAGHAELQIALEPEGRLAAFVRTLDLPAFPASDRIELRAETSWTADGLTLQASGLVDQLVLQVEDETIEVGSLRVSADARDDRLNYTLALGLPDGQLQAEGLVTDLRNSQQLVGRLYGRLNNVKRWSPWFGELDLKQGAVDIDLALSGSAREPKLAGTARVDGFTTMIPTLAIEPRLDLALNFATDSGALIDGKVSSGDSQATINGKLAGIAPLGLQLNITGDELLLADSDSVSLQASPNLQIELQQERLSITGDIGVTRAYTRLAGIERTGGPQRSADVVVEDDASGINEPTRTLTSNLDLSLAFTEPGRIEGYGLQGEVTGKVRLRQRDNGPTLANGELVLTGRYRAYGQDLTIKRGRLIYANAALDDPVIDAFATRTIGEITVGVRVSGQPGKLTTRLESENGLSEADMLSYLVLGRPSGSSGEPLLDSNRLAAAAASLALKRSEGLVGKIGENLGGTELSLTDEIGGLALAVGKQLSPKLYVGYTVGLLEPVDIATVRYKLDRRWSLESELADEARASLKYRIESD